MAPSEGVLPHRAPPPVEIERVPAAASRLGLAVTLAALALWAQLGAIPLVVSRLRLDGPERAPPSLASLFAFVGLGLSLSLEPLARRAPARALAAALGGVPLALAFEAIALGVRSVAHYDPPARWLAALTAAAYVLAAAAWAGGLPRLVVTHTAPARGASSVHTPAAASSPSANRERRAPPLRRVAPALVLLLAAMVSVVIPSWIAHEASRAPRGTGAILLRSRDALTSAGGLLLGLTMLLSWGTVLARRAAPRANSTPLGRAAWASLWAALLTALLVKWRLTP